MRVDYFLLGIYFQVHESAKKRKNKKNIKKLGIASVKQLILQSYSLKARERRKVQHMKRTSTRFGVTIIL